VSRIRLSRNRRQLSCRRIHSRIRSLSNACSSCYHVPTCRKPDHSNFVRSIFHSARESAQPIFCASCSAAVILYTSARGVARGISQDCGNSLEVSQSQIRCLPDRWPDIVASARKHDDRNARIVPSAIDCNRRCETLTTAFTAYAISDRPSEPCLPAPAQAEHQEQPRPYRHLSMSRRWLPDIRLCAQTATRECKTESGEERLHHNRDDDGLTPAVKHTGEDPSFTSKGNQPPGA